MQLQMRSAVFSTATRRRPADAPTALNLAHHSVRGSCRPIVRGRMPSRARSNLAYDARPERIAGREGVQRAQAKAQPRPAVRRRMTAVVSAKSPKTAAYIDGSGTA